MVTDHPLGGPYHSDDIFDCVTSSHFWCWSASVEKLWRMPPWAESRYSYRKSIRLIYRNTCAIATTLLIRHCNDELGIRNAIQRNVLILLIMYMFIFVTRLIGYYEWESFLQSMKQILLSFSMIIMPCFYKLNFLTWTQNKGTQIVPKWDWLDTATMS